MLFNLYFRNLSWLPAILFTAVSQASTSTVTHTNSTDTMQKVNFENHLGIKLVGNLRLPANFTQNKKYPAIVVVGPAGAAKEQTAGLYAQKLAGEGFVTIVYDASFQGESGGTPRYQENTIARVEDVRAAVDFLVGRHYVDENKIGVLGICAGGGYVTSAAMTERRIKAVGLSVPVNGGRENRAAGPDATISSLEQIAQLRSDEARGGEPTIAEWMPDSYQNATDIDHREGYDYYRTGRNPFPSWKNMVRFSTMDAVYGYDAFYLADSLLTQPLQIAVGTKLGAFGSNQDGHALFNTAASEVKDIMVMEGASHFDLYDKPEFVDPVVDKLSAFYKLHLV